MICRCWDERSYVASNKNEIMCLCFGCCCWFLFLFFFCRLDKYECVQQMGDIAVFTYFKNTIPYHFRVDCKRFNQLNHRIYSKVRNQTKWLIKSKTLCELNQTTEEEGDVDEETCLYQYFPFLSSKGPFKLFMECEKLQIDSSLFSKKKKT